MNKRTNRFNTFLFEALFYKIGKTHLQNRTLIESPLESQRLELLEQNEAFLQASIAGTTNSDNVETRLNKAMEIL